MIYLKSYKLFENVAMNMVSDIEECFLELIDNDWIIYIEYLPERWLFHDTDSIKVLIKKKDNESKSRYPFDARFKVSDVSEYTLRLMEMFYDTKVRSKITLRYCKIESIYTDIDRHDAFHFERSRGLNGYWVDAGVFYSSIVKSLEEESEDVVAIEINLFLKGKNLDH